VAATAQLELVGCGLSLYLRYLELFEIDASCYWCLPRAVL
jgi:uncharacterized membrane protein